MMADILISGAISGAVGIAAMLGLMALMRMFFISDCLRDPSGKDMRKFWAEKLP